MWLFNFFPTWIVYLFILAGITGIIFSFLIGFIGKIAIQFAAAKLPLQVLSILLLTLGVYLFGGKANQEIWEARVKEMEEKVKVAEEKAKEVNTVIEYKYIDKVKVVKEVQTVIKEKIKEVAHKIDSECKVSSDAIDLLNSAAKNITPGEK